MRFRVIGATYGQAQGDEDEEGEEDDKERNRMRKRQMEKNDTSEKDTQEGRDVRLKVAAQNDGVHGLYSTERRTNVVVDVELTAIGAVVYPSYIP